MQLIKIQLMSQSQELLELSELEKMNLGVPIAIHYTSQTLHAKEGKWSADYLRMWSETRHVLVCKL